MLLILVPGFVAFILKPNGAALLKVGFVKADYHCSLESNWHLYLGRLRAAKAHKGIYCHINLKL